MPPPPKKIQAFGKGWFKQPPSPKFTILGVTNRREQVAIICPEWLDQASSSAPSSKNSRTSESLISLPVEPVSVRGWFKWCPVQNVLVGMVSEHVGGATKTLGGLSKNVSKKLKLVQTNHVVGINRVWKKIEQPNPYGSQRSCMGTNLHSTWNSSQLQFKAMYNQGHCCVFTTQNWWGHKTKDT